jgi:hypothetical protein
MLPVSRRELRPSSQRLANARSSSPVDIRRELVHVPRLNEELSVRLTLSTAVMHNAISKGVTADIKGKIAGVALFGDTRNLQDKGHIPNFPTEKSKVWCNASDGVCGGMLNVNMGHLSYSGAQINEAARYLAGLAKKGG